MPVGKPVTVRFEVVNQFDTIYQIRSGPGIGAFAPRLSLRRVAEALATREAARTQGQRPGDAGSGLRRSTGCTLQRPLQIGLSLLSTGALRLHPAARLDDLREWGAACGRLFVIVTVARSRHIFSCNERYPDRSSSE